MQPISCMIRPRIGKIIHTNHVGGTQWWIVGGQTPTRTTKSKGWTAEHVCCVRQRCDASLGDAATGPRHKAPHR